MVDQVKNALFTDKVRGVATLVLLLMILFLVVMAWLFPRNSGVSAQTVVALEGVVKNMTMAAQDMQRAASSQQQVNEALRLQLSERKGTRDKLYDDLLKNYGIDGINGNATNGMQSQNHDQRGGSISQGVSGAYQAGNVLATDAGSQKPTHAGPAAVR